MLIKGARGMLAQTEKAATTAEPSYVDALCSPINAPGEPRVGGVILGMKRNGGAESNKIACLGVGLRAGIFKIDIQLGDKIVFRFGRLLEEKFFSDDNSLCRGVLELHGVALTHDLVLRKNWNSRVVDDRSDRHVLRRVQDDGLVLFRLVVEQNCFGHASPAIGQTQFHVGIAKGLDVFLERRSCFSRRCRR